jgi:hypothetical protein
MYFAKRTLHCGSIFALEKERTTRYLSVAPHFLRDVRLELENSVMKVNGTIRVGQNGSEWSSISWNLRWCEGQTLIAFILRDENLRQDEECPQQHARYPDERTVDVVRNHHFRPEITADARRHAKQH